MMKRIGMAVLLAGALLLGAASAEAAEKWDLPLVGQMVLPQHVTFEKGEQQALPFLTAGGPKWAFTRNAMLEGSYYTMTYADGPDFSYGWASSHVLGAPYFLKVGDGTYKGKTTAEQMDLIAAHLNQEIRAIGAVFSSEAPLVRIQDKKHPRWEGSFVVTTREKGVTYREAYHVVLQVSGFQVVLGIIASDADASSLSDDLGKMLAKRSFYKDRDLLDQFLKRGENPGISN